MKLGFVLKMITCLFFLGQCHMIAALPHLSGRNILLLLCCFYDLFAFLLGTSFVSLQVLRGYRITG